MDSIRPKQALGVIIKQFFFFLIAYFGRDSEVYGLSNVMKYLEEMNMF